MLFWSVIVAPPLCLAFDLGVRLPGKWGVAGSGVALLIILAGGVGTAAMVGAYLIWFATRREPMADRLFTFGLKVLYWAMVLSPVAFVLLNVGHRRDPTPLFAAP